MSSKCYKEKLEIRNIEEKVGGKGKYFVVDFEVELMNEDGIKVASDLHQFFLKI